MYILRGHRLYFSNKIVFLSLKIIFVMANSVDPDEMQHDVTFHLVLHCLQKTHLVVYLTLYLIETPLNAYANRADPNQAALV